MRQRQPRNMRPLLRRRASQHRCCLARRTHTAFLYGEQLEPATANVWVQWAGPRVQGAKDVVDLDVEQLPWRQWLRQREDCAFVVGVGLVAGEIRRVLVEPAPCTSHARAKTCTVLTRADGSAVQIFMGMPCLIRSNYRVLRYEDPPVEGKLENWLRDIYIDSRACTDYFAAALPQHAHDIPDAASINARPRAACLNAATSGDDAASSAASASTCVTQRACEVAVAAAGSAKRHSPALVTADEASSATA